jgi:hypothetical protein
MLLTVCRSCGASNRQQFLGPVALSGWIGKDRRYGIYSVLPWPPRFDTNHCNQATSKKPWSLALKCIREAWRSLSEVLHRQTRHDPMIAKKHSMTRVMANCEVPQATL